MLIIDLFNNKNIRAYRNIVTLKNDEWDNIYRFQSICDLLYYKSLFDKDGDFFGKSTVDISLWLKSYEFEELEYTQANELKAYSEELVTNLVSLNSYNEDLTKRAVDEILYIYSFNYLTMVHYKLFIILIMGDIILEEMYKKNLKNNQLIMINIFISKNEKYIDICENIFEIAKEYIEELYENFRRNTDSKIPLYKDLDKNYNFFGDEEIAYYYNFYDASIPILEYL